MYQCPHRGGLRDGLCRFARRRAFSGHFGNSGSVCGSTGEPPSGESGKECRGYPPGQRNEISLYADVPAEIEKNIGHDSREVCFCLSIIIFAKGKGSSARTFVRDRTPFLIRRVNHKRCLCIIAIQLFNATATALNCISQICCLNVALIS